MNDQIVLGDTHAKLDELYSRVSDSVRDFRNMSDEEADRMVEQLIDTVLELYVCWEIEKRS